MPIIELSKDQIELNGKVLHGSEIQMESMLEKIPDGDKKDEIEKQKEELHEIKTVMYEALEGNGDRGDER